MRSAIANYCRKISIVNKSTHVKASNRVKSNRSKVADGERIGGSTFRIVSFNHRAEFDPTIAAIPLARVLPGFLLICPTRDEIAVETAG